MDSLAGHADSETHSQYLRVRLGKQRGACMDQFKQGMRLLAGGVTIVTTGAGQDVAGLTATAVCSLTAAPPRLLVCLNTAGVSFDLLRKYGRFCVNIVGTSDEDIAKTFAGILAAPATGKFGLGQWTTDDGKSPRLTSAMAAFECSVHSLTLLSTHCLTVGDVTDVHIRSSPDGPLLYHEGRFGKLAIDG